MADRVAKNALYDGLASVAKALGNGRRAELVDVLAQGDRSVEELAGQIGQSVANTSQHLQILLGAGLVATRRQANRIYYSLAGPGVGALWSEVRRVATAHVGELEDLAATYLGDRSGLRTMTRSELRTRIDAGDVVVIDVRPEAEYRAGHIPGAISIPVEELARRLGEIPPDRQVVAYCRGPFCVYADDAVRTLDAHRRDAARLEDGYPEWRSAGHPVTPGPGGA